MQKVLTAWLPVWLFLAAAAAGSPLQLLARGNGQAEAGHAPVLEGDPGLEEYVNYALTNNPGIRAAFEKWQAALEGIAPARARPDPRFSAGYFVRPVETRVGPQEWRLGLAQTFPWFGRLALQGKMTTEAARAARQRYEAARLDLVFQVESAYYELYYLERAIAIQASNLQWLDSLEKVARANYRTGRGSQADVLKIQMELGKLADELQSLRDQRTPVRSRLNAVLDRPAGAAVSPVVELPPVPPLPDQAVLERHPVLRAHDFEIERTRAAVERAHKEGYPSWTLSLDYIATSGREGAGPMAADGRDPLVAMLSLNLPLDRSQYRAGVRQARARQQAAELERRESENRLGARLQLALYHWHDSRRKIDLYRDSLLPRAEQALDVTQQAFAAGKGSFLDLIDAQRLRLQFQLAKEQALADHARHRAEIDLLTGGRLALPNLQMKDDSHEILVE